MNKLSEWNSFVCRGLTVPNIGMLKYLKQILTELKGENSKKVIGLQYFIFNIEQIILTEKSIRK